MVDMNEPATTRSTEIAVITANGEQLPDPRERCTLDVPEAGRFLGLSRALSYNAAQSGQLPTLRFGRKLRVPTAAVWRLLDLAVPSDER